MKNLLTLFILLVLSLSHALAQEDLYTPRKTGLRWEYSVTITMPEGKTLRGTMTREITGTTNHSGKTYFVSTTSFTGLPGMDPFTVYERKTPEGIYAFNSFDPKKHEYLSIAHPLAVGKKWTAVTDDNTFISVDAQEDVSVGDKKYEKCLKISSRADGQSPSGVAYLAPKIGIVKDTAKQGGMTFEFTLKSFNGNK